MYVLKSGRFYYARESERFLAGWQKIDNVIGSADIFLTNDRKEALSLRKVLRRKYCAHRTTRLVKLDSKHKHLQIMLMGRLSVARNV